MENTVPIAFVARASLRDGLGHLVRTLSVAKEVMRDRPVKLFLVGDGVGQHLVAESGVPWTACESDAGAAENVTRCRADVCVFDTLDFEDSAFSAAAERAVTVSLSPVFTRMEGCDHLVHRTERNDPAWAGFARMPEVHKGLGYAILPPNLKAIPTRIFHEQAAEARLAVAVSMGGADASNRTLRLLEMLGGAASDLVLYVALGDAYTHSYEQLLGCANSNRQEIILLKSNESMWRVLRNASLLVCAGGLTTYEAVHVGMPAINVLQRPEWAYLFEELTERGACLTVKPGPLGLDEAARLVIELSKDRQRLLAMHHAAKNIIPKGGAKRVAKLLCKLKAKTKTPI